MTTPLNAAWIGLGLLEEPAAKVVVRIDGRDVPIVEISREGKTFVLAPAQEVSRPRAARGRKAKVRT